MKQSNSFLDILPHLIDYLIRKQKSKGQEKEYKELKMAEYLMPNFENLSIDDKRNSASGDGGLAPWSAHAGPSARTPIGTSGIFPAHVSAE